MSNRGILWIEVEASGLLQYSAFIVRPQNTPNLLYGTYLATVDANRPFFSIQSCIHSYVVNIKLNFKWQYLCAAESQSGKQTLLDPT